MSYENWKDKVSTFRTIDVRNLQGNFFPGLQKQAMGVEVGHGITIIQNFEPHPIYPVMEDLGFEHHTEEVSKNEFHAHFYRVEIKKGNGNQPFKPIALLNFPLIDEDLGKIAVDFWNLTWNDDKRTIPYDMRLMLSLTNAVGAGRIRQATRELVKAYFYGVESAVFDDVFELLVWNQGIGYFSSEIGPSPLFQAYKLIKKEEQKGTDREDIKNLLKEKFGEKNKDVSVKSL